MNDHPAEAVCTSVNGSTQQDPESLDTELGGLEVLPVTEHLHVYEEVLAQLATELDSGEPAD